MSVAYRSHTYVAPADQGNATWTAPAGLADGDVLLFILYREDGVALTVSPAGFTAVTTNCHSTAGPWTWDLDLQWHRVTTVGSEPTYRWEFPTGTHYFGGWLIAFSGCIASGSPIAATPTFIVNGTSATTAVIPTYTPGQTNTMLVAAAGGTAGALFSWSAGTERADADGISFMTQFLTLATATGTRTATTTAGYNAGFMVSLLGTDSAGSVTTNHIDATSDSTFRAVGRTYDRTSDATLRFTSRTLDATSNARLLAVQHLDASANATLRALARVLDGTSNATLRLTGSTLDRTSDAVLNRRSTLDGTSDARLKALGQLLNATSNATFRVLGQLLNATSDASLVRRVVVDLTSDATFRDPLLLESTSDARLRAMDRTLSRTSNATLRATGHTLDRTSNADLINASSLLGRTIQLTSDARLERWLPPYYTLAFLKKL